MNNTLTTLNINDLESYSLSDLKAALQQTTKEFSKTFNRELSRLSSKLNYAINCKYMDNIDLSYYNYNSIKLLINSITTEIIKYMNSQLQNKILFNYSINIINEPNADRGQITKIETGYMLNKYYIDINFNTISNIHQLIKTITHELRHVYQYELNLFNMIQEVEEYNYIDRPFEVDAREYVDNNFDSIMTNISGIIYPMFETFELK